MPHPAWEDLSEFFDPDEFATTATIRRDGEIIGEVLGIFDDPNQIAALGNYELDHPTPRLICPETDIADISRGDVATIEGRDFDIMQEPELDGTGIATLILAEPNVIYDAGI
ncbi:head-tail joining protein [Pukyongiella litopenaei]|uniref:Uncharacterized protein n=1 Tax=Pukyongiella litopenaei TaxID=2605946 RepID=A0A2S0MND5_9RHOB|nr:hypothetical protein [Pukyongiella litopenaei]AVO37388.1 hypothetical protein C6Y53_06470 [Pukyongiella litopenaei]